jgi:hypothetical protein
MISLTLTGLAEMAQRLERLGPQILPAVAAAMEEEGNRIMLESQQLVPIETGRLLLTSQVSAPMTQGAVVTVELSYGRDGPLGPAPYAAVVEFEPRNHPHGGQAHFLQQPLFAAENAFAQHIAGAVRASLGR